MRITRAAFPLLGVLVFARPAFADTASDQAAAEALFSEGRRLVGEGKYAEACPKFVESQRLDPAPGTLVNLGGCYEKNGQTASAWATFKLAASLAAQKGRTDYETTARQHVSSLEPLLSMLTIVVPADVVVAGLVVTRDGSSVGNAEWGLAIPVDPGTHAIEASAPKKKKWSSNAKVEGNAAKVQVSIPALEDDDTGIRGGGGTSGGGGSRRMIGLVVGGAGLVAIGVGSFFGLQAKSKQDDALTHCRTDTLCTAEGVSLGSDAKSAATLSTIMFGVGLAAVATGIVLYVTAPSGASSPSTVAVRVSPGPRSMTMTLGATW